MSLECEKISGFEMRKLLIFLISDFTRKTK